MQATVCPEAAPDDAWQEALARASQAAARSITAGVAARLAAEHVALRRQQQAGEPGGSPPDAADRGAAEGRLPEFKTLAEDDLEAGLALQTEASAHALAKCYVPTLAALPVRSLCRVTATSKNRSQSASTDPLQIQQRIRAMAAGMLRDKRLLSARAVLLPKQPAAPETQPQVDMAPPGPPSHMTVVRLSWDVPSLVPAAVCGQPCTSAC